MQNYFGNQLMLEKKTIEICNNVSNLLFTLDMILLPKLILKSKKWRLHLNRWSKSIPMLKVKNKCKPLLWYEHEIVLISTVASHCCCWFWIDVPRLVCSGTSLGDCATRLISSQTKLLGTKSFQFYLINPVPVWKSSHGLLVTFHISEMKLS